MVIRIGDREIVSKIMPKEKAQEKYDDAVSSGKGAAMLQENEKFKDLLKMNIGNILPG